MNLLVSQAIELTSILEIKFETFAATPPLQILHPRYRVLMGKLIKMKKTLMSSRGNYKFPSQALVWLHCTDGS